MIACGFFVVVLLQYTTCKQYDHSILSSTVGKRIELHLVVVMFEIGYFLKIINTVLFHSSTNDNLVHPSFAGDRVTITSSDLSMDFFL